MPKTPDLPAVVNQHTKLIGELLPKAMSVLSETMNFDPWEEVLDENGEPTGQKKLNLRISSQRLKAAAQVVTTAKDLGDQALKRQAGSQLKSLLAEIKRQRKADRATVIDGVSAEAP